tara:strand:+ start:1347 stop:2423 length:1077 start_codon:yes stop_codon:yes gene_type:complete
MKIFQILKSFVFLILSLITILKCFFNNKKKAQLVILKENSPNFIDLRIKIYQKQDNNNFVNFVRGQSFTKGIKIYFSINNVIFFNHIFNILEYYKSFFGEKRKKIESDFILLISKILHLIHIEKFYTIDDYRNIQIFSKACKLSGSRLFIFQHGRISPNLRYQKTLKNLTFEKYFVWNNYFKKKLVKFDKKYSNKNIFIFNKFLSKNVYKNNFEKKEILIIEEDKVKKTVIIDLIKRIKRIKKTNIYFKFRPNNKVDKRLKKFLISNDVICFHQENIYKLFKKFKINYLLASNSSLLLESSYFFIFPILFYDKKPILKDYIDDKVVFPSKINNIKKVILKTNSQKKNLIKIRQKVWFK